MKEPLRVNNGNGNGQNGHAKETQFRIEVAKELGEQARRDYISRGVDPQKAAFLAETVEWTFGRERRKDIF